MRKKSHISLAKYLINNMQVQDLHDHKKAFYLGSILPDLKPSFLTKRHNIDETFEDLITEIKMITVDYDINRGIDSYYARHLGVITHYLSDYCTFPHNSIFTGNIKEHVHYEKDLKLSLKEYVNREDVQREREIITEFFTFDEIIHFIRKTHREYLKAIKAVHEDIQYIIDMCYRVVDAILMFFEIAIEKLENDLVQKHNVQVEYSRA
ncbi:MAG TPA: zinc dependent phospholipase C family protein [Mobilitalea sp.]|nr:zinc dependent phospholipase C family protein [Mobilitalea sp.]